jgi:hypothetical protein
MRYYHNHPWDKPAKPPGQSDPRPTKNKNWIINKELKSNTQHKEQGAHSTPEKRGRARS